MDRFGGTDRLFCRPPVPKLPAVSVWRADAVTAGLILLSVSVLLLRVLEPLCSFVLQQSSDPAETTLLSSSEGMFYSDCLYVFACSQKLSQKRQMCIYVYAK